MAAIADLIDTVVEVRDARLPRSTAVASLHPKLRRKKVFVLLNRADLADATATAEWIRWLHSSEIAAFAGVGTQARSLGALRAAIAAERKPARGRRLRVAVVGAPNTGKSSVINALGRRKRARAENRPGVTRGVSWLRCSEAVDVLDTPGLLPPRIIGGDAAWQLALCGDLGEAAYDPEEVAGRFAAWLRPQHPQTADAVDPQNFSRRHGMMRRGGELDGASAARKILSLFRAGAFGRFTFELPEVRRT